jgi:hypothetical protein
MGITRCPSTGLLPALDTDSLPEITTVLESPTASTLFKGDRDRERALPMPTLLGDM